MAYIQGLGGQSGYGTQAVPPSVPNVPTGNQGSSIVGGQISPSVPQSSYNQLPSPVMQNINNYNAAGMGTIGHQANEQRGLNNYNRLASQYGDRMGQWTPWALQEQSAGGYGGNANNVGNLFLGGAPQGLGLGNTYDLSNGMLNSKQNIHNVYSGDVQGYGASSHQGFQSPVSSGYWSNLDPGKFNNQSQPFYNSINDYFGNEAQQYVNSLRSGHSGPFDVFNGPSSLDEIKKQIYLGSMPGGGNQGMSTQQLGLSTPGSSMANYYYNDFGKNMGWGPNQMPYGTFG